MQRSIHLLVLGLILTLTPAASVAAVREPEQVVTDYIAAFKAKDKAMMLSCLSETFFAAHKVQYLSKVEAYDQVKLRRLLEVYGVGSLDDLRAMSGEALISTFLDKPISNAYWRSFDATDLLIDVERVEVLGDQATVRSWIYKEASLPAKVETIYALTLQGGEWRIDRFQKKIIKP